MLFATAEFWRNFTIIYGTVVVEKTIPIPSHEERNYHLMVRLYVHIRTNAAPITSKPSYREDNIVLVLVLRQSVVLNATLCV